MEVEKLETASEERGLSRFFLQYPVIFLILVTLVVAFSFQGSRGLYESTEGRYAECARQSLEKDSLDEPLLNGEHHWTKPPLTYYVTAAGFEVLGGNAWGARIGLSIAFSLTVLLVGLMARDVWGKAAAPFCALVYALSPFTAGTSNALSTDVYLTLFEAAAMAFFWRAIATRKSRYILLMWMAFGAAFLTKGPVALLPLPAMAILKIYLYQRKEKAPLLLNPLGILLFLGIGASWYVLKIMKYPDLFDYWFYKEMIGRNLYGAFDRNGEWYKPPMVYGPPILFGAIPWTLFLLWKHQAIPWPRGQWRRIDTWPHSVQWIYLVSAVVLPLLVLTVARSRLALYALPLSVPMSVAIGMGLHYLYAKKALALRSIMITAICMLIILTGAKGIGAYVPSAHDMARLATAIRPHLEQYPRRQMYVLRQPPLYGLQFYLKEWPIETVELEKAQDILKQAKDSGIPQIVLVRTRTLRRMEENMDKRVYKVETLTPDWVMVIIGAEATS